MAFNSTITVNLDAVNVTTIDNATGEVLRELGAKLFAGASRIRRHLRLAEQALADAHNSPLHIQQSLGAEVATTRESFDRLVGLVVKAHDKVQAEQAAQNSARRRMPAAIDWLSTDEWETVSNMGSVFDDDIPSTAETESVSLCLDAMSTGEINSSFDLIDFGDEDIHIRPDSSAQDFGEADTVAADSSTEEDEAGAFAAASHRPPTQHPSTSSASKMSQPHESGPLTEPSTYSFPPGVDVPASSPWDVPTQRSAGPSSSSSTTRPVLSQTPRPSPMAVSFARSTSTAPTTLPAPRSLSSLATARPNQAQSSKPSLAAPSSASVPQSSTASTTKATSFDAVAAYDAIDYDYSVYGYVGGSPVPVVPAAIRGLSTDQLVAVEAERYLRHRRASAALSTAEHRLRRFADAADDVVLDLAVEVSMLQSAVDKAERLRRVILYEDIHRTPPSGQFIEEREAQAALIEAECRRLRAGGAPRFWRRDDEAEARRRRRGYSIWPEPSSSSDGPQGSRRPPAPSRTRSRSRTARSSTSSSSRAETSAQDRYEWTPRDSSEFAREQFHERIRRQTLLREGEGTIPPCRTVHIAAFDSRQNNATLQALMRRCGFDVDEDTRITEYYVTHNRRGNDFHYFGFVTFRHMDAAIRCVNELDRMDVDRHHGMPPAFTRNDAEVVYQLLTFSFSKNELLNGSLLRRLDAGDYGRGRSSSRAPSARRRQPSRARFGYRQTPPAEVTDSEGETGFEDN